MHDPVFSIAGLDGTARDPHSLSEWNRLLAETEAAAAAVAMHADTRPEPAADADAVAAPGKMRVLCLAAPLDSLRAEAKRASMTGRVFDKMAAEIWQKRRRRAAQ